MAERERDREILTLREASEFLNCHPSTIYRLVKSSQIPAFRLGGSWRFVKPELHRWIKDLTEWPPGGEQPVKETFAPKTERPSPPPRRRSNLSSPAATGQGRRLRRRG
jgi:excisionase family DNA binding protein